MAAATTMTAIETTMPVETLHMKLHPQALNKNNNVPQKVKNRLRLDPARALEPARKKISTIEAQRIMTVFEETIRRVEIVTLLPQILLNLNRFGVVLGSELVQMLTHHKVIQDSYDDIRTQLTKIQYREGGRSATQSRGSRVSASRKADHISAVQEGDARGDSTYQFTEGVNESQRLRLSSAENEVADADQGSRPASAMSAAESTSSMNSQTEAAMRSLSIVAQQLSHSCKNILRAFANNPAAYNALKVEMVNCSAVCKQLITSLNELRDILLGKLLTTPMEEKERKDYLREITERERQNGTVIGKLETELKTAIDDKDDEIKKKNDIIRRLQADLHQIEKFSEEHIRRVKSEAEKQETADIKNSEGRRQKLQQEMSLLNTQLQNLISEHRENELVLRKKKFKIETEVENWILKYDMDMGDRQDEFEQIDTVYTEEKRQLQELEERFKTLETEYSSIQTERTLARERREAAGRELALMVRAATTIQAFWRSFKVRKALKSKKKKGGGGKKKK